MYVGMWDIFSEVYTKTTEFIPTLFFCGTQEELDREVKKDYGEVVLLPKYPEVIVNPQLDWTVIWSLFWAAAHHYPEDVCLFSGIDDLPISTILWDSMKDIPDDKYVIPFGKNPYNIPSVDGTRHIIANGYNCGKGKTLKKIFHMSDNLQEELYKLWGNRHMFASQFPSNHANLNGWQRWWGMDEAYMSCFVHDHPDVVFLEDNFVKDKIQGIKIDRAEGFDYDLDKLNNREYSFAHIPRPLTDERNMDKVTKLLKDMEIW